MRRARRGCDALTALIIVERQYAAVFDSVVVLGSTEAHGPFELGVDATVAALHEFNLLLPPTTMMSVIRDAHGLSASTPGQPNCVVVSACTLVENGIYRSPRTCTQFSASLIKPVAIANATFYAPDMRDLPEQILSTTPR
jgi:hypothetical protein